MYLGLIVNHRVLLNLNNKLFAVGGKWFLNWFLKQQVHCVPDIFKMDAVGELAWGFLLVGMEILRAEVILCCSFVRLFSLCFY
jgi:hypothetical protein